MSEALDFTGKVVLAMQEQSVGEIAASPLIAKPFEKIFAAHWSVRERIAALGITDPKQAGRLVGDIMKTHKGLVDAGDVKRVAEELLKG